MRIKRLDITGFKSFMDRVVFSFDDGITGVVGPNGCGKSNVVDAIRWSMGEQSAKNLRGRGMEDVIFNGSETHAPLSMAEVTLTFSVDAGRRMLPETLAGLPEVSVTRRLFRSGESEYQINKTTCRLLDVTELFLGTGVGHQGLFDHRAGSGGTDCQLSPRGPAHLHRRGRGRHQVQGARRAAERKMEYTQQNLLRVNDIVVELEKRLDSLERQARRAEKYKRLKAEMREIELHAASHRWLELHASKKLIEAQVANFSADERATYDAVIALEERIATRRNALEAGTAELEALAASVYTLQAQAQLDEQNVGHWTADLAATQGRVELAEAELTTALERKASAEQDKANGLLELDPHGRRFERRRGDAAGQRRGAAPRHRAARRHRDAPRAGAQWPGRTGDPRREPRRGSVEPRAAQDRPGCPRRPPRRRAGRAGRRGGAAGGRPPRGARPRGAAPGRRARVDPAPRRRRADAAARARDLRRERGDGHRLARRAVGQAQSAVVAGRDSAQLRRV
jgi:chromosome segregation ATPase